MKALIISDDDFIVSQAKKLFESSNFDIIKYKWLLKALDNIEEIHPDLIFVSSREYPRHWKTLVQFAKSGIGGEKICIFLYEPQELSEDDAAKAKALGINGIISNFQETEKIKNTIRDFFCINTEAQDVSKSINIITDTDKEVSTVEEDESGYVLITNPITGKINTGKVTSYMNNKIECSFSFELTELQNNDKIKYSSFINSNECFSFSSEIFILNENNNTAILTIQEKYEEI